MGQNGNFKFIEGGVCAAKGFKAGGIHAGIRKNKDKKDLALIICDTLCSAAAVYTTNLVKGAPLDVTKKHLANGKAQAVICNSGNANTCAEDGVEHAEEMARLVQKHTGIDADDVIVASTGVIGQKLDIEPIKNGMSALVKALSESGSRDANYAIMTTDTVTKDCAVEFELNGKKCRMGGIAKGSGMIHPNMATMLVFLTTDTAISSEMLKQAISEDVKTSFNMVSVDGDTSTNDMLSIMASGLAGNKPIDGDGEAFGVFKTALSMVTRALCKKIAADGEGATRLIVCSVCGAASDIDARKIAKSVITSSLFKAAVFGADANWGRVLCALGYSGAKADVNKIAMSFCSAKGEIRVCANGAGLDFDEDKAKKILLEKEITVKLTLEDGEGKAEAWGCDLTYDYVKINGDYRT
jgi:glutamate N-acetyltransferase/amino-acid N-acetyltransferase